MTFVPMTREEIESELPHFGGLHKRALSTALHYNRALASAISRLMVYRDHHPCPTCDDKADANTAAQRTLDAEPRRRAWEIADRCPSCGGQSLFIGAGGWLTCSVIGCKEPGAGAAIDRLRDRAERAEAKLDSQWECDRRDRLQAAADLLARRGYRACDILACNCGSWHPPDDHGGNLRERAELAEQEAARERERAEKAEAALAILNAAGTYIARHDAAKAGACFACGGTGR